ncbi:hypothetical protein Tco_1068582 [Tanacetum coccineum]|uniref:Uncharacterized protein n=1 Tax=Tanacetum coccineum TaxID=301880 RepID=A0ABQ5HI01_9ASTR
MDHTSSMEEAQRGVGFALDPLTELAQHVTSKNDMLAILRRELTIYSLKVKLCEARRRITLRQFILALGLHTEEEMAEAGFGAYWSGSERAPEKVTSVDLFYLHSMDRGTTNVLYLLARYLFRHAERRKSGARLSGGHFIRRLMAHFGVVNDQGLRGLSMVASELSLIDLQELRRLNICSSADEGARLFPTPLAGTNQKKKGRPPPPLLSTVLCQRGLRGLRDYDRVMAECCRLPGSFGELYYLADQSLHLDDQLYDTAYRPCCKEIDDMVYSEKDVC